jgi:S-adenosylmethionine hydrolase
MGMADGYVGAMKGVVLEVNPLATVIDVAHDIPPGDVIHGAFVLSTAIPFFPQGTVHIAVVDPEVGSADRRPIAVEVAGQYLVGPDNGLFSLLFSGDCLAVALTSQAFRLPEVSSTFHGRDIFAPAAGHLSLGAPIEELGQEVYDPVMLELLTVKEQGAELQGSVIHIDRFGNIITNIKPANLRGRKVASVRTGELEVRGIKRSYYEVECGEPLALWGSSSCLEVAVNRGRANERALVGRGARVVVTLVD